MSQFIFELIEHLLYNYANSTIVIDFSEDSIWLSVNCACIFVNQQLLDEQLSSKQALYLASFGTDVQPLWTSEAPRILNPTLYDRIHFFA